MKVVITKETFGPLEISAEGTKAVLRALFWGNKGADEIGTHYRGKSKQPATDEHRQVVELFHQWMVRGLVGKSRALMEHWGEEVEFEFEGTVEEARQWLAQSTIFTTDARDGSSAGADNT